MTTSQHLQAAYVEARTRLSKVTDTITASDLKKKLGAGPNSIGFLLQHIAEVELLFCKNVFGHAEVKVVAHTVIDQKDTGVWTDLQAIQSLLDESGKTIISILASVSEDAWSTQNNYQRIWHQNQSRGLWQNHFAYGLPCGASSHDSKVRFVATRYLASTPQTKV